jgi:hypothetical protein
MLTSQRHTHNSFKKQDKVVTVKQPLHVHKSSGVTAF